MSFGGVIKLQGEREYREALSKIRAELGSLKTYLREASNEFKNSTNATESLQKKSDLLAQKLVLQKEKVAILQKTYDSYYKQQKTNATVHSTLLSKFDEEKRKLEEIKNKLGTSSTEYKKQEQVVAKLSKAVDNSSKQYEKNNKTLNDTATKLNKAQLAMNKVEDEIKKTNAALKLSKDAATGAAQSYGALKKQITAQQVELRKLKEKYASAVLEEGKAATTAKSLATKIKIASQALADNRKKMQEATNAANSFDKSLKGVHGGTKTAGKGFNTMGVFLGNLAANALTFAISKAKELAEESVKVGAQFEATMSKVKATSGASELEMVALTNKARELGQATKFSASEIGEAFVYMAMAGWKPQAMLEGINGILNLTAASGGELAQVCDIVTDALTAMGYSAKDAGKFADVLAATCANSNTNVELMGETFKYVAPVAGALGMSIEDVAIAIGLLANAGIKGSQAGTTLRSMLINLSNPTESVQAAMDKIGFKFKDAAGKAKPLGQVMDELREKMSKYSDTEKAEIANAIAGKQAVSGMLAIINAAPEDYENLTKAVKTSEGAAAQMAETMTNNVQGKFVALKSKIEGVQIALFEKLKPAFEKAIEAASAFTNVIGFLVDHSNEVMAAITGISTAMTAYTVLVANKLPLALKALQLAFNFTKTKLFELGAAFAANPIGMTITVISALVAAFIYLWNTSEDFRNFWIGVWDAVKDAVMAAGEVIGGVLKAIWDGLVVVWDAIKGAAMPVIDAVVGAFVAGWELIKQVWEPVSEFFSNLFKGFADSISPAVDSGVNAFVAGWELIKQVWELVAPFFNNVADAIGTGFRVAGEVLPRVFEIAWDTIKAVWDVVQPYFALLWNNILTGAKLAWDLIVSAVKLAWEAIQVGWNMLVEGFKLGWNILAEGFKFLGTLIGSTFTLAWEVIKAGWDTIVSFIRVGCDTIAGIFSLIKAVITGNWSEAWEAIKGIVGSWGEYFQGIWDNIQNIFGAVGTWFGDVFSGAWEAIKGIVGSWGGFFQGVWDNIQKIFGAVGTWFGDVFSAAWEAIKSVFSGWGSFFGNLWNTICNTFTSIGSNIANAIGNAVKAGINGIIGMIENTINSAIGLINGAIGLINNIPGVDIPKLGNVGLPRLAKGGVLDNGARAVIAGEAGAEAIVPLEHNTQWMRRIAREINAQIERDKRDRQNNVTNNVQNNMNADEIVEAIKLAVVEALSGVTVEMDDEKMGKFVESRVTQKIYS